MSRQSHRKGFTSDTLRCQKETRHCSGVSCRSTLLPSNVKHVKLISLGCAMQMCSYCRPSHTGDAIRVMYSSVSVGVVHVLCACAQMQSTVWCSFHTAACSHLTTHILSLFCASSSSCCCCCCCCCPCSFFLNLVVAKVDKYVVFLRFWDSRRKNHRKYQDVLCASEVQNHHICDSGSKNHGIYTVFG